MNPLRQSFCLTICLCAGVAAPVHAQAVRTWTNPSDGDWSQSSNWDPFDIPLGLSEAAVLPDLGTRYDVHWNRAQGRIGGLTLGKDATLRIDAGELFELSAPTLMNDGTISIGAPGTEDPTRFFLLEDISLEGNGRLQIAGENTWFNYFDPKTITNAPGHTLEGWGVVLGELINEGILRSSELDQKLEIDALPLNTGVIIAAVPRSAIEIWGDMTSRGSLIATADARIFVRGTLDHEGPIEVGDGGSLAYTGLLSGPETALTLRSGVVFGSVDLGDLARPQSERLSLEFDDRSRINTVYAQNFSAMPGLEIGTLYTSGEIVTDQPFTVDQFVSPLEEQIVLRSSVQQTFREAEGVRNESEAQLNIFERADRIENFGTMWTRGSAQIGMKYRDSRAGEPPFVNFLNAGTVRVAGDGDFTGGSVRMTQTDNALLSLAASARLGILKVTGGSIVAPDAVVTGVQFGNPNSVNESGVRLEDVYFQGRISIGSSMDVVDTFVNDGEISIRGRMNAPGPADNRPPVRLLGNGSIEIQNVRSSPSQLDRDEGLTNGPYHTLSLRSYVSGKLVNQGTLLTVGTDQTETMEFGWGYLQTRNGNLSLEPSSRLILKLGDDGDCDRVHVGGIMQAGGQLQLRPLAGATIEAGNTYRIIHAPFRLEGMFESVIDDAFAPLIAELTYTDTEVFVTLVDPSTFCEIDLTTVGATAPYDPGFGVPDGTVDGTDLSFFVERWLEMSAFADFTTTNTNPGDGRYGVPDGVVDPTDLSYYVEAWLAGCP